MVLTQRSVSPGVLLCPLAHLRCLNLLHGETPVFSVCLEPALVLVVGQPWVPAAAAEKALPFGTQRLLQVQPTEVLHAQSCLGKGAILGKQATAATLQT